MSHSRRSNRSADGTTSPIGTGPTAVVFEFTTPGPGGVLVTDILAFRDCLTHLSAHVLRHPPGTVFVALTVRPSSPIFISPWSPSPGKLRAPPHHMLQPRVVVRNISQEQPRESIWSTELALRTCLPKNVMVDYAALAQDRLDTDMGDYHMITVVTQRAVNEQLKRLWNDPTNKLHLINLVVGGRIVITSAMGPPKVQFQLGTRTLRVVFFLEFKNGYFAYLNMKKLQFENVTLDNCTLAFNVDMSMEVLTNPATDSKLVQALRDYGLGEPGNYQVMQLVIDFTTANLMHYRNDLSDLPQLAAASGKPPTELVEMRTAFTGWVRQYLDDINLSTSMGVQPAFNLQHSKIRETPPTGRHPAATLAPTDLTFQCYPYLVSSDDDFTPGDDNNMLLYLEMTNDAKLPRKSLDTSKNWVVRLVPQAINTFFDGTVALSRKIFLEDWLLVNLEVLNRATWISATASNKPTQHSDGTWKFSNNPDPNMNYRFMDYEEDDGSRYWEFNEGTNDSAENHVFEIKPKTSVVSRVDVKPGKAKIVIKGHSEAEAWFRYKADYKGSNFWATMDWTITITLDVDSNGQLKVTVTAPDPSLDHARDELPAGGNEIGIWNRTEYQPHYSVQGNLSKDTLTDLEQKLNNMFQSNWVTFCLRRE
ncbi:hypothetical protein DFH09DRAFT_1087085 [Mycena vulgaris]|nr:hypothetical protein DFH09DRAFT_1087085 [Mycena vulgaris]